MIIKGFEFQYESEGTLCFDPGKGSKHFDDYWAIVKCDADIADYYRWFLERYGQSTFKPNRLWGFHISVIKGEVPVVNSDEWAKFDGKKIKFNYGNYVSYSNGRHAWINIYSDELCDIREYYGLTTCNRMLKYHATLGRLKNHGSQMLKGQGKYMMMVMV